MHMAMVLTMLGAGWVPPSRAFSLRRFAPRFEISLLPPLARRRSLEARRLLKRTTAFAFRSELVVCLHKQQLSLICCGPILGLRPCGWRRNPHPLRSTLIDVCLHKHQWRGSVPGFRLHWRGPYHCHMHGLVPPC